jgi:hypothetical protein
MLNVNIIGFIQKKNGEENDDGKHCPPIYCNKIFENELRKSFARDLFIQYWKNCD